MTSRPHTRRLRTRRRASALLATALISAACSGGDADELGPETPPTIDDPNSRTPATAAVDEPPRTIDDALGGHQAVQDFAIFVGMWHESGDEPETFYADVLDVATRNATGVGSMSGGFDLAVASTLSGEVVDRDADLVPGLVVDYGVLSASGAGLQRSVRALVDDNGLDGTRVADLIDTLAGESHLLVEVITADYAVARTHAGPGDMALMDLGAVPSVAPGDDVAMSYLFGQTLPGDPDVERDLTPLELFRYRWNRGLVDVLADPGSGEVRPFADRTVEIVDRSTAIAGRSGEPAGVARVEPVGFSTGVGATVDQPAPDDDTDDDGNGSLSQREIKQLILLDYARETEEELEESLLDDLWEVDSYIVVPGEGESGADVLIIDPETNEVILVDELDDFDPNCVGDECRRWGSDDILAETTIDEYAGMLAAEFALAACAAKAAEMNRQNEAQVALDEISPWTDDPAAAASESDVLEQATAEPESATESESGEDPLAPGPGPVDCSGDLPSGPPTFPTPPGMLYGDIHVHTFDGRHYANQAVGEFLLFDNGVAEIQVRTEPWDGSVLDISVATAFAVRIGEHEVSMHGDGTTWIDGEPADIERGETIDVGDGELLWWDQGWVVLWPDGTVFRAQITAASQIGEVSPAAAAAVGMLGDADGDPDNDFFTRDGEVLAPDLDDDFVEFYRRYVDSWRISDDESAFHYDDGESTATFTDPSFPSEPATVEALPADARAEAEEVCARVGVKRDEMFADCVLDVGATGEPWFAYQAFSAQASYPESRESASEPEPEPGEASGDGDNVLRVGATTIEFGPEPPVTDPTGPAPRWTCEVADGVFTVVNTFTESPTVNWELDIQYIAPDNARGLDESFRLVVRRNGVEYAWVQTIAEQFADAIDTVTSEDDGLVAEGELYVNDPPTPGLGPVNPLPAGAQLTPFTLAASCP